MGEALSALGNLSPPVACVVVIGLIAWKLLQMFEKQGNAFMLFSNSMAAHTDAIKSISENVKQNTEMTKKVVELMEKKS